MDYVLKGLNEVTFVEETEGQDSSVLELFTDSVVGMWGIFSIVDGFFFHSHWKDQDITRDMTFKSLS